MLTKKTKGSAWLMNILLNESDDSSIHATKNNL